LVGQRGALIGQREALIGQRKALIGQRKALIHDRKALVGEREALVGEQPSLVAHRDTLIGGRARPEGVQFNGVGVGNLDSRDGRVRGRKNIFQPPVHDHLPSNHVIGASPRKIRAEIFASKANKPDIFSL
jgi:hypothetical protein